MAEIVQKPRVEVSATMQFNEAELRALDALVGYGADAFLKVFYEKLGKAYMQPHEAGLRTLFESVRQTVPGILRRTDDARRIAFEEAAELMESQHTWISSAAASAAIRRLAQGEGKGESNG